jgi:hypothetical protein
MDDVCFLIYTNERYLPIVDLTTKEFDRYFPENPLKRYIVSNNFSDYVFENNNSIFLNSKVEFDGMGNHFAQTMIKSLKKINEDYIIFFCDDYMLIDKPDLGRLNELLCIIKHENIDFFSFASMLPKNDWEIFNLKIKGLENRNFYNIPEYYQYQYSVQPCIWRKGALMEILKYNPSISIHQLDTSCIKNKEGFNREMNYEKSIWSPYKNGSQGYNFKCVCTDFKAYDELFDYEFFIFSYIEILRHGFFNFWQETNTKKFLQKFIEDREIKNNQHLNRFIPCI